eukprot:5874-Heterococcus_DN1.PRE.4
MASVTSLQEHTAALVNVKIVVSSGYLRRLSASHCSSMLESKSGVPLCECGAAQHSSTGRVNVSLQATTNAVQRASCARNLIDLQKGHCTSEYSACSRMHNHGAAAAARAQLSSPQTHQSANAYTASKFRKRTQKIAHFHAI